MKVLPINLRNQFQQICLQLIEGICIDIKEQIRKSFHEQKLLLRDFKLHIVRLYRVYCNSLLIYHDPSLNRRRMQRLQQKIIGR
jgi:hypothetical protein